jgi:hypothetical protein
MLNLGRHAVISLLAALAAQQSISALTISTQKVFTSASDPSIFYWGPSAYTQTVAGNATGMTDCLATLVKFDGQLDVATWRTLLAEWQGDDVWTGFS